MRIDPNYIIFAGHPEWSVFDPEKGYIPTDEAPEEAKEAMKRYNEYAAKQE